MPQTKRIGTLQWNRTVINSHRPCESCGFRRSKIKLELPVGPGVTHRLCKHCDPHQ
jgi:ribosomal protein L32